MLSNVSAVSMVDGPLARSRRSSARRSSESAVLVVPFGAQPDRARRGDVRLQQRVGGEARQERVGVAHPESPESRISQSIAVEHREEAGGADGDLVVVRGLRRQHRLLEILAPPPRARRSCRPGGRARAPLRPPAGGTRAVLARSSNGPPTAFASLQRPAEASAVSLAALSRSVATSARLAGSSGGLITARSIATSAHRSSVGSALAAATGAVDHALVGGPQHLAERAHARQPIVEAAHAQVEDLGRLLAAHLRRLAGLPVHRRSQRATY